uniref:Uncharacterized protein n=1 Tax=Lotus japonicus TaxID=34305 RepID=I3S147_LOTJA|nr:unknown [Lotus japonicus]
MGPKTPKIKPTDVLTNVTLRHQKHPSLNIQNPSHIIPTTRTQLARNPVNAGHRVNIKSFLICI